MKKINIYFFQPILFFSLFLSLACSSKLPVYPLKLDKNFSLLSHEDKVFQIDDLYKKISLLYFGFTRCPSVCPQNLQRIQKAQNLIGMKKNKLQTLMITVDPEYDSPKVLRKYFSAYDMKVLGLWCKKDELEDISKKFGASFFAVKDKKQKHFIEHSAYIFLLDKKAQLRYFFPHEDSPQKIASVIRRL